MTRKINFPYDIISDPFRGGASKATIKCDCGAIDTRNISGVHNPEMIVKYFQHKGWDCSLRAKRVKCPECDGRTPKHKGWEPTNPQENHMAKAVSPPITAPAVTGFHPEGGANAFESAHNTVLVPPARRLTGEERRAVRDLLDRHFDDNTGRYIDGYSDERIGAELNLPWKLVTELRELAYGPLRGDSELDEIRSMICAIRSEVGKIATTMSAAIDAAQSAAMAAASKLDGRFSAAEERLAKAERRITNRYKE